jgi:hypothetical protein
MLILTSSAHNIEPESFWIDPNSGGDAEMAFPGSLALVIILEVFSMSFSLDSAAEVKNRTNIAIARIISILFILFPPYN